MDYKSNLGSGLLCFAFAYFMVYYLGHYWRVNLAFFSILLVSFTLVLILAGIFLRHTSLLNKSLQNISLALFLNLLSSLFLTSLLGIFFGQQLLQRAETQGQAKLGMPIDKVQIIYGVVTRDAQPMGDELFRFALRIFATSDGSALMTSANAKVFVRAQRPNTMPVLGQLVSVRTQVHSFIDEDQTKEILYSRAIKQSIRVFTKEDFHSDHSKYDQHGKAEQLQQHKKFVDILHSEHTAYSIKTDSLHLPYLKRESLALWQQKLWSGRSKLRNTLFQNLRHVFPKNGRSLFLALLFGSSEELPQKVKEQFRLAGCIHILALSGFHVGILATIIRFLLQPLLGLRRSLVVSSIILAAYLFLVGPLPSLTRAVFMFLLLNFCRFFFYKGNSLYILAISAIVQSQIFPETPLSLSFQLSYSALLGLILFAERSSCLAGLLYGRFENLVCVQTTRLDSTKNPHTILATISRIMPTKFFRFIAKFLFQGISISLAVMLCTAPILIANFARLHWIGFFASLIEAPIITLYMWSSLLLWPVLHVLNTLGIEASLGGQILQLAYQKFYHFSLLPVEFFSRVPPWAFQKASGVWLYSHLWAYLLLSTGILCTLFRYELYRLLYSIRNYWEKSKPRQNSSVSQD